MDVRGFVRDRLADYVAHEPHDRGIFVDLGFVLLDRFRRDITVFCVLETARADAEMLKNEMMNFLGHAEMPDDWTRGKGPYPVFHDRIGKPRAREVDRSLCVRFRAVSNGGPASAKKDRH